MSRQDRLEELQNLVSEGTYRTQNELVQALRSAGWQVTQASISRDIRALGLEKVDGVYLRPVKLHFDIQQDTAVDLPWGHIRSLASAGDHMIVLRTAVATAQQVAAAIDSAGWQGVAGTIAGDDTVFVATRTRIASDELAERLRSHAGLVDRRSN